MGKRPDDNDRVKAGERLDDPEADAVEVGAPAEIHCTDLGNARKLRELRGRDFRWCGARKGDGWLDWTGSRWRDDEQKAIVRAAFTVSAWWRARGEELVAQGGALATTPEQKEARDMGKAILKHAAYSESARAINAMVALLRAQPGIAVRADALDVDPYLFNTPGGTVDLRTGSVRPCRRDDLITRLAGCAVGDARACPEWRKFLRRIMADDDDRVAFLQRWLGYCLSGLTTEEKFVIAWGTGRNGKSTLVETARHVMGDYARSTAVETFTKDRQHGGIPNDLAALAGARFVTAAESQEGIALNEALIKAITGGDAVPARFLNREWFEYIPTYKAIVCTNHKPTIRGTDEGIWRRTCFVPFTVTIPEAEQDRGLGERLRRAEGPAILAWMVEGFREWQRIGLVPPKAVTDATALYRSENDLVGEFVTACCVLGASAGTTSHKDLFGAFARWCEEGGLRPCSPKRFGQRLDELGARVSARNGEGRAREGIALLNPKAPPLPLDTNRFPPHPAEVGA